MTEGLVIEEQGEITIYRFTDSSEEAVDVWGESLATLIENMPLDEPFHVLMDVSAKQVSFSRHAREKTKELFTRYRTHKGRFAFLFSSPTAPYYSRIFFASLGRLNFQLSAFNNREKALDWLHESCS